jgi:hypothetical protein
MERGQRQAEEGVTWVLEADKALVGISEAVAHITEMTTQIAGATEEQTAVAEEISRNITTIAHLADQTSEQAHQSADLSKEDQNCVHPALIGRALQSITNPTLSSKAWYRRRAFTSALSRLHRPRTMQAAKGIWPIYKEPDQVSGFFHFGNVLFTKRSQN